MENRNSKVESRKSKNETRKTKLETRKSPYVSHSRESGNPASSRLTWPPLTPGLYSYLGLDTGGRSQKLNPLPLGEGGDPAVAGEPGEGLLGYVAHLIPLRRATDPSPVPLRLVKAPAVLSPGERAKTQFPPFLLGKRAEVRILPAAFFP